MANDDTLPGPPAGRPTELQQLEAALAAGVITPELFATLRAKLAPAAPVAASPASRPAPAAPSPELPSLLEMFGSTPSPVVPSPGPPAALPAAASPPRPPATAADEAAARRRIEEHLAKLRQEEQAAERRRAAAVAPPVAVPTPPAPTFYPEPAPVPTPTFYSAAPPAPPTPALVASPPVVPPRRAAPEPASRGRSLLPLLLVLLLAVVGGLAYYFTSTSHPDEELTTHQPAAPEPVPAAVPKPTKPKRTKATKRAKTKKKAAKAPVAATEASDSANDLAADPGPTSVADPAPAANTPEPAGRPIAAAAEAGDDAATTQVRNAMASYYADLNAPPLHASQHFAPQVERLYIRQNLTPEAIDAELARSFFPDNQHAVCQIEPGTLRVSSPTADGSRTATFTEVMRLYRVSLQKYQRLRTQVRVRFNAAYQIVYMRQEKLLANTFEQ